MRRSAVKWGVVGAIAILILIQFIQPSRTNPPVIASRSLEARVPVPMKVQTILQRSCYNCHSSATIWPWYSHVAPISWMIVSDVNTARSHINMQDWAAQINEKEGKEHLGLICKLVREGTMPPAKYRIMHKEAYLSPEDTDAVCAWSQQVGSAEDSDKAGD
jgi:hypothetical protein